MGAKKVQSPREFVTNEGTRFILGRTQEQNDSIVRQYMKENQNFWWFHADKIPSCHAVLFTDESKLTKNEIEEVSSKIREYSKLKYVSCGYVVYTQLKYIHLKCGYSHNRGLYSRLKYLQN